jgi:hypothetical protein
MSQRPRDPTNSTQKVATICDVPMPPRESAPPSIEEQQKQPGTISRINLKRIRAPRP